MRDLIPRRHVEKYEEDNHAYDLHRIQFHEIENVENPTLRSSWLHLAAY
jgi:hypothetical protein